MSDGDPQEQSFQAVRMWFRGVSQDPVRMRFWSHVVLLLVGWFALIAPMSERLAVARKALTKAHRQEERAGVHVHLVEQRDRYEPRIPGSADLLDWQMYMLSKVDAAGVRLSSIEPYKSDKRGPFHIMRFNVNVVSDSYAPLVDFVDRVEHGERLVRLEDLVISQSSQSMAMTFMMRALVKEGLPEIPLVDSLGPSAELAELVSEVVEGLPEDVDADPGGGEDPDDLGAGGTPDPAGLPAAGAVGAAMATGADDSVSGL